jgi:chemotaxis protein MotB
MADSTKAPIIIKKKVSHHGHHGGAWKVAYADFVTAMMALFIVLWLLNTSQKTKQAISGYFKDPTGVGKLEGTKLEGKGAGADLQPIKDDMSKLKERLKSVIKMVPHFDQFKGNIELTITEEGLRIELFEGSKGMFFERGRPEPSAIGKELLSALAKELGRLPNRIIIEGHTDGTQFSGSEYSNWELSTDRANQARRLMMSTGLAPNQIAQVRGFADQDLHNSQTPTDQTNRRVSVIVKYQEEQPKLKIPVGSEAKPVGPNQPPATHPNQPPAAH